MSEKKLLQGIVLSGLTIFTAEYALSETSTPGALNGGVQAFIDGRYQEAEAYFLKRVDSPVTANEALVYLSRVYLETGEGERAIEYIEKALEIDPTDAHELVLSGDIYCHQGQRSSMFAALKLARKCKAQYEAAVEADSANAKALVSAARFHLEAPAIAGGSDKQGAELLERLSQVSPEHAKTYKIRMLENDGNRAAALQLADELYKKGFKSVQAQYEVAKYYRDIEVHDKAQQLFAGLISRSKTPDNRWYINDSLLQLGEIYIKRETDVQEGIRLIEKYKSINTNPSDAHYFWSTWSLAKGYQAIGQQDKYEALVEAIKAEDYKEDSAFAKEFEASL